MLQCLWVKPHRQKHELSSMSNIGLLLLGIRSLKAGTESGLDQHRPCQNDPTLFFLGILSSMVLIACITIPSLHQELVGVIGRVGSGKTTFLQTIIGELYPLEHFSSTDGADAVVACAKANINKGKQSSSHNLWFLNDNVSMKYMLFLR